MIYDLKKLNQGNNTIREDPAGLERDILRNRINLAIAERLEALVEVQKPRFVELESNVIDCPVILVNAVSDFMLQQLEDDCVRLETRQKNYYVKGTLAEVLAKLRGDK